MVATTITGTYSTVFTLLAATNPATFTAAAKLQAGAEAFYADQTVVNAGVIAGGSGQHGLILDLSGAVTNQVSGIISGYYAIYDLVNPATVVNAGSVSGSNTGIYLHPSGAAATGGITNQSGGTITGGLIGINVEGAPAVVLNAGSIAGFVSFGISLYGGGAITNQSSSTIFGGIHGGAALTVVNAGSIIGQAAANGILLDSGSGSITNQSGGIIRAPVDAVYDHGFGGGTLTLVNAGTIAGGTGASGAGVLLLGAAIVTNETRSVISGQVGIDGNGGLTTITNAGTITGVKGISFAAADPGNQVIIDSGTIIGTGGTAIAFGGTGSNLLVLESSFSLKGVVVGGQSASNTVQLLGTAAGPVVATYSSHGLINFQTVAFAPGISNAATLVLPGNTILPGTIAGFTGTLEAINLTGLADTANTAVAVFNTITNRLTVTSGINAVRLQLDSEDYTGIHFAAQQNAGGGTQVVALPQPTVTSVTTLPVSGTLGAKATVTFTVTFSAPVTVTGGIPTLLLSDGGTASYKAGSGKNALTFLYTVAAGDASADLGITGTALNGAVIQRGGGNPADLSGAVVNPAGVLVVDTVVPPKIVNKTTVDLHGIHTQYLIASKYGTLDLQDTVAGRDGTPALNGVTTMVFTDGTGMFDATGTAEDVARLYQEAFNRKPDLGGLAYWTARVDVSHVPLSQVAASFASSLEFITHYGTLTDAGFVERLYQTLRGTADSPWETAYWTGLLASGSSRGDVLLGVAESQESDANTLPIAGNVTNAAVTRLYQTLLNRAPESSGLANWAAALANGASLSQVAQGFIDSPEFQLKSGTLDASDFVTALYNNALQRPPDAPGLAYWVGQLQQGASEASVAVAISESPETRLESASATHANWVFIPA